MSFTFHIEHLEPEKLIISAKPSSGKKKKVTLQNVKEYLTSINIIEGPDKDYMPDGKSLIENPSTYLIFSTPASVLKALSLIPVEIMDPTSIDEIHKSIAEVTKVDPNPVAKKDPKPVAKYGPTAGNTAEKYQQIQQKNATMISRKDCPPEAEEFVTRASQELFDFILNGVKSIQKKYKKSKGIEVLLSELDHIDTHPGDLFVAPKYLLALCSLYFATIEKASPLREKKSSDIAPKLDKLFKEACHRSLRVAGWNDLRFYETHITYTKLPESPRLPPTPLVQSPNDTAAPSSGISATLRKNADRGELLFKALFMTLTDRKAAVEKRIQHHYFWQNHEKNEAKLAALKDIETACTHGKNTEEILNIIKEKHAVLTQSTSALPLFFRKHVTTAAILEPYKTVIQTP